MSACRLLFRLCPLLILLLALGGLGTACGGSQRADGPAGKVRPYTDAAGRNLKLPTAPRRVIALSEPSLDASLALGLKPIATTDGRGQNSVSSYLKERAAGVASVGSLAEPRLERIAKMQPDLILTDGTGTLTKTVRDKLQQIAPTAFISKTAADWRQAFSSTADVLGRKEKGEEMLGEYDARIVDIKGRLGKNAGAEVSVVRWGGIGLPAVLKEELQSGKILRDLGLTRPPSQRGRGPGHSVPTSLELMDDLDGDWMYFGSLGAGGPAGGAVDTPADPAAAREALKYAEADYPRFKKLRAYRAGQVVPVDGSAWTSAGGYLAGQVVLDDLERTLTEPK